MPPSDTEARPRGHSARIEPLPTLPIFFKLAGRRAIIAGGSDAATWKAELLVAAGARVRVLDPAPSAAMEALAAGHSSIELVRRAWTSEDLADAALAIGALEGEVAEVFRDAARVAGVPVNIVDVPSLCDFQFGTVLSRGPLLIAISTDGAAPVWGQALRTRIEALLPERTARWAEAAQAWRARLRPYALDFAARRRFWETFAGLALGGTNEGPSDADFEACLSAALESRESGAGRLILVGLGPGDAEGATLKAVRALQSADLIVHEKSVPPATLALGRREAARMVETEVEGVIAHSLAEGRTVALAATGDPDTCKRWAARRQNLPRAARIDVVNGLACATCLPGCPSDRSAVSDPA